MFEKSVRVPSAHEEKKIEKKNVENIFFFNFLIFFQKNFFLKKKKS